MRAPNWLKCVLRVSEEVIGLSPPTKIFGTDCKFLGDILTPCGLKWVAECLFGLYLHVCVGVGHCGDIY